MESRQYYPEYRNIFSNDPLSLLIRNYNMMFALLKPALWLNQEDEIDKIERCLYTSDTDSIYWDYLDATHTIMMETRWIEECLRCYRFTLKSWKNITFTTDNKYNCKLHPSWVIFLDDVYKILTPDKQNRFNLLHIDNCTIECNYFNSDKYKSLQSEILKNHYQQRVADTLL